MSCNHGDANCFGLRRIGTRVADCIQILSNIPPTAVAREAKFLFSLRAGWEIILCDSERIMIYLPGVGVGIQLLPDSLLLVACLFCGFSCVRTGTGKLEAGNGGGISLTLLLVLLGSGRKTWPYIGGSSCRGSRGIFALRGDAGIWNYVQVGKLDTRERSPQKQIRVSL